LQTGVAATEARAFIDLAATTNAIAIEKEGPHSLASLVVVYRTLEHALAAQRIDAAGRRLLELLVLDRRRAARGFFAGRREAQAFRGVADETEHFEAQTVSGTYFRYLLVQEGVEDGDVTGAEAHELALPWGRLIEDVG
jgi:hypothetical protein